MQLTIRKSSLLQYNLIYLLILDSGSLLLNLLGFQIYYLLIFVVGLIVIFCTEARENFKLYTPATLKNSFIYLCFLLIAVSAFTLGGLGYGIIMGIISKIIIVVAAICCSPQEFSGRFIKIVVVMAVISDIIFVGYYFGGIHFWDAIQTKLYYSPSTSESLGAAYGLFVLCFNYFDPTRNTYMFGEPGLYQLVLVTALFLLLFTKTQINNNNKRHMMLILIVTILTTQSTTGYFNLLVLIGVAVLGKQRNEDARYMKKILILLMIIGALYLVFVSNDFIEKTIIAKIFSETGKIDFSQNTGAARWNGFVRLAEYMKEHPIRTIIGVGFDERLQSGVTSCNGLTNSILDIGLVTVIFILSQFARTLYRFSASGAGMLLVGGLFIIINSWIGQPLTMYNCYIILGCGLLIIGQAQEDWENHYDT